LRILFRDRSIVKKIGEMSAKEAIDSVFKKLYPEDKE